MTDDYNYVLGRKYGFASQVQVLDDVTKLLPDDTWLTQLEVKSTSKGKELRRELLLRGESANAGRLVSLLEESKVFIDAAPRSPTTKIQPGPGEIFDLGAQLAPTPAPPPVQLASARRSTRRRLLPRPTLRLRRPPRPCRRRRPLPPQPPAASPLPIAPAVCAADCRGGAARDPPRVRPAAAPARYRAATRTGLAALGERAAADGGQRPGCQFRRDSRHRPASRREGAAMNAAIARLPAKQQRALAIALLVVAVVVFLAALLLPVVLLHRHYDNAIASLTDRLDTYRRVAAQAPEYRKALDVMREKDAKRFFLKNTAANLAGAELQELVRAAVEGNGGRITISQNQAAKDDGRYRQIGVNVQFFATTPNLQKILYALETQQPYLVVENLTLRPLNAFRGFRPAAGQEPEVNVQLDVVGFDFTEAAKK